MFNYSNIAVKSTHGLPIVAHNAILSHIDVHLPLNLDVD